jgi:hypothetical protein
LRLLFEKQAQPLCDQLSAVLVACWKIIAARGLSWPIQVSDLADYCLSPPRGVSGMPQVVKVQSRYANRGNILFPICRWVEIAASHGAAALHGEHKVVGVRADVLGEMPGKVCLQGLRNRHCPMACTGFWSSSYQSLTWQVDQL